MHRKIDKIVLTASPRHIFLFLPKSQSSWSNLDNFQTLHYTHITSIIDYSRRPFSSYLYYLERCKYFQRKSKK